MAPIQKCTVSKIKADRDIRPAIMSRWEWVGLGRPYSPSRRRPKFCESRGSPSGWGRRKDGLSQRPSPASNASTSYHENWVTSELSAKEMNARSRLDLPANHGFPRRRFPSPRSQISIPSGLCLIFSAREIKEFKLPALRYGALAVGSCERMRRKRNTLSLQASCWSLESATKEARATCQGKRSESGMVDKSRLIQSWPDPCKTAAVKLGKTKTQAQAGRWVWVLIVVIVIGPRDVVKKGRGLRFSLHSYLHLEALLTVRVLCPGISLSRLNVWMLLLMASGRTHGQNNKLFTTLHSF
eukprot:Gb_37607 [translate_table: standard]